MNKPIIIVSGLPRSGTSLVMQMLAAGGVKIATDNIRVADIDNPKGYLEFERVKKLRSDSSWLKDIQGQAIKIISPLLYYLPPTLSYKIIFVERNMQEILDSQKKMYQRLQKKSDDLEDSVLQEKFSDHLKKINDWIGQKHNIECHYVQYREILRDPLGQARVIERFLDVSLDLFDMSEVIDFSLYRNRKIETK